VKAFNEYMYSKMSWYIIRYDSNATQENIDMMSNTKRESENKLWLTALKYVTQWH